MELDYAKKLLTALADGVDPLTGELLPEDSVCNKADIVRAFHCILKVLHEKKPQNKAQPENYGKPWTEEDEALLCRMFDSGCTKKELCSHFKRTQGGIAARLIRLGKISDRQELYAAK